mgnify:CR=1 FL=1
MKKSVASFVICCRCIFENMVSEDTAEFVKKHIENCPDCAAELKAMKSGKEISEAEPSKRESDAKVITAVKKKIAKKIVKTVAVVCLAFAGLLSAVLLYTGIGHPVTRDNISLSTKTESGYNYIILETEAGNHYSLIQKQKILLMIKMKYVDRESLYTTCNIITIFHKRIIL